MKKNIFSLVFAALALLFAGTSCVDEFETVLNHELSTDTDVSQYMPTVTYGAVKLGTFNVLYGAYGDNENYKWAVRKGPLAKAIVENDFDVLGMQEVDRTIRQQLPALVTAALPKESTRNYQWWFMNRDKQDADAQTSLDAVGEGLGIMYDANKYTLSDQHYFWLTDKDPDVINVGWDETSYRRIACCAVVTENANPDHKFFLMVTHAPLAAQARLNAASLICAREEMYNTAQLPAFLIGDMNAAPDDPATGVFTTAKWNDSYIKVPVTSRVGGMITFHSKNEITDVTTAEKRIDYIYYKNLPKVLTYKVDYNKYDGYYPSDHCPVMITFDIPEVTPPEPTTLAGSGTAADPYQIGSVADWATVATSINGSGAYTSAACYILTADLQFAGDFVRLTSFAGTLDGNNHSMKGITGEAEAESFGGVINVLEETGVVKNLYVEATLSSAYKNLGGVVGTDTAGSLIDGVTFKGDLTGTADCSRIGGIIGTSYSVVINCGCLGGNFVAGTATQSENMGGIAGRIERNTAIMANCYSFLDKIVSSYNNLGGVTGGLGTNAYCLNVYSTCVDITTPGGTYGGCIGYAKSGNIRNVYAPDEAAFNGTGTKWVANDKEASDWTTTGAALTLANMKNGAVTLPSSGESYESFVAALNAGIADFNALPSLTALTGNKETTPYGIVNKPNVTLREWEVGTSGYPVVKGAPAVDPGPGGGGSEGPIGDPITVNIVFKDYAEANGWIDGTDPSNATEIHTLVEQGGVRITAGGNDGTDNGVYNSPSYYDWRFYQARGGYLTISVPDGNRMVSVTIDYYEYKNGGLLVDADGNQLLDETEFPVSAQEATFYVGNQGTATNGQARILGITVKYVAWGATTPDPGTDPGTGGNSTTVKEIVFDEYGPENNWVNGTGYASFTVGDVTFSASADEGKTNGVYYEANTSPGDWRFYQARGGGMTITAATGHQLVKVKFTYGNKNNGVLLDSSNSIVASDTDYPLSGTTVMFTVGSTDASQTAAQARINKIVVEYK